HIVRVDTVEEVKINIKTQITFEDTYSFENLKQSISQVISAYLLEIRKDWANQNTTIVRIAQIESRILSINGIVDIINTKINEVENNLTLSKYQIPVIGEIINERN